jgi:ribosome-associated protein
MTMRITPTLDIDETELEERFVRASGPGGQNVNKVSTAVELRFNLAANLSIPDYARGKLKRLAGRRLTNEGVIIIQADRFRSQEQNRSDARERLHDLIAEALERPKPRIKTKPSRGAREERIKDKTVRGKVKKMRSRKVDFD